MRHRRCCAKGYCSLTTLSETTVDEICDGLIAIEQPKRGYRFNIDSVFLARFAEAVVTPTPQCIVDVGAGSGIVGLLLAKIWDSSRVDLVEIQAELAELARRNAERNRLEQVHVHCHDIFQWDVPSDVPMNGRVLVISNPPFFELSRGRPSPHSQLAIARHEIAFSLNRFLEWVSATLPFEGDVVMIHQATRWDEIHSMLQRYGVSLVTFRWILPFEHSTPHRILFHARKMGTNTATHLTAIPHNPTPVELDPLVIERCPGEFTGEVARMLCRF